MSRKRGLSRRSVINIGLMSGAAGLIGKKAWGACPPGFIDQTPFDIALANTGAGVLNEAFPMSPFILNPFTDPLTIPQAMRPGYRQPDGTLTPDYTDAWTCRYSAFGSGVSRPTAAPGRQDAMGARPRSTTDPSTGKTYQLPDAGTHQLWPGHSGTCVSNLPQPILYHIRLQVREAQFTTSPVLPIDKDGRPIPLPPGVTASTFGKGYLLPRSTIYGFNGTFPGPMINAEYGKPVCVRFENDLDLNPYCLNRNDFGAPDWAFLTHLHNGHTAPESDGQPHHMSDHEGGYQPGEWCDNLYLGYPAGGDEREKQSTLWFHDHRMHHTGANVYKGMVGMMPHYDPILDPGDETARFLPGSSALGLPGRRINNPDGSFDVKYDVMLGLYDCALDDGVTPHADFHNGQGELHPEWWGKTFFRHYPNHGFVGDVFTVNGTAYPVMHVSQRNYRLRFLDCSVSRIYQLFLMRGTPQPAPGTKGQWQLPNGQQCMKWTQIAAEGGLLPNPIVRNSFELWPAKRREFVVDFSKYSDGSPTQPGDVIYMVNSAQMDTGRLPNNFPPKPDFVPRQGDYMVPMMKIVIDGPPAEPDYSVVPSSLRPNPILPSFSGLPQRQFTLERSGLSADTQWVINGLQFDALNPLALPKQGQPELWTVANGGGGWVHPMHMHMEEHRVLSRNGKPAPDANHPDDTGREDVVALYPSESVQFYRNFRTFKGKYVAHCHNLAHEDHNMMFGWAIV